MDPLTRVLNRRGLEERLRTELARASREQQSVAVVMFDLDHFKAVNDRYGHEIGDRVLTWIGSILREQARTVDIVARAGGEEFVIVLPGQVSLGSAPSVSRMNLDDVDAVSKIVGDRNRVAVSVASGETVAAGKRVNLLLFGLSLVEMTVGTGGATRGKLQWTVADGVTDAPANGGGTNSVIILGRAMQSGVPQDRIGVLLNPFRALSA